MAEERGTYTAGADANDAPQGTQPPADAAETQGAQPGQWYTQVANRFMEAAYSEFGLGATRCFLYLIRCTQGFHQESVTLTVDEFCNGKRTRTGSGRLDNGTKLTRVSVLAGLAELREKGVISVAQTGRGRGITTAYRVNPPHLWHLGGESIGIVSIPIQNGKGTVPISTDIGIDALPKDGDNGKASIPIQVPSAQAGSGAAGIGKKVSLKKAPKETTDAGASGAATARAESVTTPTHRSKPKSERDTHPNAGSQQASSVTDEPRPRNPIWDALVEVFGYSPESRPEASNWGKVVHDLKLANATADDVRLRAANHALAVKAGAIHWRLTPNALVTHWGELARVPSAPAPSNGLARAAPPRRLEPSILPAASPSDPFATPARPVPVARPL